MRSRLEKGSGHEVKGMRPKFEVSQLGLRA
jgi:hypothetical protein